MAALSWSSVESPSLSLILEWKRRSFYFSYAVRSLLFPPSPLHLPQVIEIIGSRSMPFRQKDGGSPPPPFFFPFVRRVNDRWASKKARREKKKSSFSGTVIFLPPAEEESPPSSLAWPPMKQGVSPPPSILSGKLRRALRTSLAPWESRRDRIFFSPFPGTGDGPEVDPEAKSNVPRAERAIFFFFSEEKKNGAPQ